MQETNGSWSMNGPYAVLVNEASATHGRPGENEAHNIQPINSTHSEMVKFGIRDPNYKLVAGFLRDYAALASKIIEVRSATLQNLGNYAQLQNNDPPG